MIIPITVETDALNRLIEVIINVAIVQLVIIIILSVRVICLTVCPYRLCCVTDLDLKRRMQHIDRSHIPTATHKVSNVNEVANFYGIVLIPFACCVVRCTLSL